MCIGINISEGCIRRNNTAPGFIGRCYMKRACEQLLCGIFYLTYNFAVIYLNGNFRLKATDFINIKEFNTIISIEYLYLSFCFFVCKSNFKRNLSKAAVFNINRNTAFVTVYSVGAYYFYIS